MRTDIGSRVKELRSLEGLTQGQFAKIINVSQGYLSQIEKGIRKPSAHILVAIQYAFNVRLEWLTTGEGPREGPHLTERLAYAFEQGAIDEEELALLTDIFTRPAAQTIFFYETWRSLLSKALQAIGVDTPDFNDIIIGLSNIYEPAGKKKRKTIKKNVWALIEQGGELPERPLALPELKVVSRRELDNLERHEAFVPVPLVSGAVAAGSPRIVEDHDIEGYCLIYQSWCKRPEDYVCVRVKGDSMEPALPDGSIVAVHLKARSPKRLEKKLVAARHGDGVVVKELQCSESKKEWFLISFNKEYPPLLIRPEEEENPIIGKVAWWWARQE